MKFSSLIIIAILPLLFSCTNHYNIPEKIWLTMNEEQKQKAIETYNQRQLIKEKQQAIEAQQKLIRENAKLIAQQKQVEAIYQGKGMPGDLIRVSLLSGKSKIGFKHRQLQPLSLKIADGEKQQLKLKSSGHNYISWSSFINVSYQNGLLKFGGIQIPYDSQWRRGKEYSGLFGNGTNELEEIKIKIMTVPIGQTQIIIYQ